MGAAEILAMVRAGVMIAEQGVKLGEALRSQGLITEDELAQIRADRASVNADWHAQLDRLTGGDPA